MEIQDKTTAPITFDKFASKNSLVLEMHEAFNGEPSSRYYCHFVDGEILKNGFVIGNIGDGATQTQAITNYARQLRGARLVIDASGPNRREIQCPNQWAPEEPKNQRGDEDEERQRDPSRRPAHQPGLLALRRPSP